MVLDREDVREVGADLERELELDRPHRRALHDERVLHRILADEALAANRELVAVERSGKGVAHEERGREVFDAPGGEQQRPLPVDGHVQGREEPGVFREQAFDVRVEVAQLVADAERRSFEDAELLGHDQLRIIRAPEACASALTTSSSTLTCRGRVTAKRTHSAMSSGVIASTPS